METAISIQNLSKQYMRIGNQAPYLALRDVIPNLLKKRKTSKESFWALKDIELQIKQGERVGIIGRNGAGKSTLLKIISSITPPTTGRIELNGRVASLLEVGTGFHPELTGIENIFLNGSILGLKRIEIIKKLDEIIDFSGVEKFINTPLKHYSSGMQLRLAFSVAAHLEAEILLVDEVLSVGDAEFQKKCFGKMEEISRRNDRTIVLVSHDLDAISNLTTSAILLQNGSIKELGDTDKVIKCYLNNLLENPLVSPKDLTKPHFTNFELHTSLGGQLQSFGDKMKICLRISLPAPIDVLEFSFQICSESTSEPIVYNWFSTANELMQLIGKEGEQSISITIPYLHLYKGDYYFRFYLSDPRGKTTYQIVEGILPFQIQMRGITNEWGWQNNVCKYIENCIVKIDKNESLS